MTTAITSDRTLDKSIRLFEGGKVREIPQTRVFSVEGDTGTHRVTVAPSREGLVFDCNCQATTPKCSHALAVALQIRSEIA